MEEGTFDKGYLGGMGEKIVESYSGCYNWNEILAREHK
jgi:hypothetical protein